MTSTSEKSIILGWGGKNSGAESTNTRLQQSLSSWEQGKSYITPQAHIKEGNILEHSLNHVHEMNISRGDDVCPAMGPNLN